MKMYSLSIQQELRRAIGKNNMFVLAKQSHQHQQGDVSKGIALKTTLDSGIDLAPGINLAPGTFGKNIICVALKIGIPHTIK